MIFNTASFVATRNATNAALFGTRKMITSEKREDRPTYSRPMTEEERIAEAKFLERMEESLRHRVEKLNAETPSNEELDKLISRAAYKLKENESHPFFKGNVFKHYKKLMCEYINHLISLKKEINQC